MTDDERAGWIDRPDERRDRTDGRDERPRPEIRPGGATFEEIPAGRLRVASGGAGPGAPTVGGFDRPPRSGRGPAVRAAIIVAGLATAIVGAGLLGPRPDPPPDPPPASPAPEAVGSPRPVDEMASPMPDLAVVAPTPAPPTVRAADPGPEDPYAVVAGRWMDLRSGTLAADAPTGCERQRVLVLGSGRIVCVDAEVTRSPGSFVARYDLRAVTLGMAGADLGDGRRAEPPAAAPPPQALTTLAGRRDVVVGDPVAIATSGRPGTDDLLLAHAAVDELGFEVGLDAFRLGDGGGSAAAIGSWTLGLAESTGRDAVESLGDLAVTVAADGSAALVGWTEAGRGIAGPVRRLVVVPLDRAGSPAAVPPAATANLAPNAADGPPGPGTPCGGALGEGFAGPGSTAVHVVCPGPPAEIRVVAVGGDPDAAIVAASASLPFAGSVSGAAGLAGNGVAVDPGRSIAYRWSPVTGTLWRIAFDAGGAATAPRVDVIPFSPLGRSVDAGGDDRRDPAAGPRPILALDAERGRLYALDEPLPVTGRAAVHVIDLAGWRQVASLTVADPATRAVALAPDGRLLYASTAPRPAGDVPVAVGVAAIDPTTGAELAYAGRLPVDAGSPDQAVIVR